jgi:lipopolysaccharide biosynthesis glycosyltransferase
MQRVELRVFFIFDENYVSPALVSVMSLLAQLGEDVPKVTLVFLRDGGNAKDHEPVFALLNHFISTLQKVHRLLEINIVEQRGTPFLGYVKRSHFSDAILRKLIIPELFAQYEHILLFDCGLIFGSKVRNFFDDVRCLIDQNSNAAVAAFSDPSDQVEMKGSLKFVQHNLLYPAGVILYFNTILWRKKNVLARLIQNFDKHREELVYAEQELLCLTLENDELVAMRDHYKRHHIDLFDAEWSKSEEHFKVYVARDYLYMKHTGSFKPWKKWVLHPAKSIFLKERLLAVELIGAELAGFLYDPSTTPSQDLFLKHQLHLLERHYESHEMK